MADRPILVTGAAGFIGSRLVRRLLARSSPVCALVKPTTDVSRIRDLLPSLQVCEADVRDRESLRRCVETVQPSGIVHLAASNMMRGMRASDEEVIRGNVLGMVNLLEVSRDLPYRFFLTTGSYLEYGLKEEPMREDDRCEPLELYSLTKLAASLLAQSFARVHRKPIVVFRVFTPYGPAIQEGRLVHQVITKALRHEAIPLTAPEVTRDFIFVDDIVDLFLKAAEKAQLHAGQIFNLGSGRETTLRELVATVLTLSRSKSAVQWHAFEKVLYDTGACQADMRKTFSHFSWRPSHDLPSGMRKTIDSLRP